MNALVESLREIGRDLMRKRLWPVAVLLLAALVAMPTLIGRSTDEAAPTVVAAADTGTAAATPKAPSDARPSTRAGHKARGKIDNPFFDPPKPAADAGAPGAGDTGKTVAEAKSPTGEAAPRPGTTPAKGTPAKETTAKETPAKDTTATANSQKPAATTAPAPARKPVTNATTPAPTTAPSRPAPALTYMRAAVRVNGSGGAWPHPMARLKPIGGARHPAALFLGVTNAGTRYAVFALAPRATSRGAGTCKRATNCRMIGLKAGQTQVVTLRGRDGRVRHYRLHVESIKAVWASAARARAGRAHVHADGRRVLSAWRRHAATAAALRTARYDERSGLLRAAASARAVKNASK